MTVGLKILQLAQALGIRDVDVARALGVARSTVAAYKTGRTSPSRDKVLAFQSFVRSSHRKTVPLDWIYDGMETTPPLKDATPSELLQPVSMPTTPIRLVGSVGAGNGEDDGSDEDILNIPMHLSGDDYVAWRVVGDSMLPLLEPGDVAVFRERIEPRNKEFSLLRKADGTCVCKQMVYRDGAWWLHSLNPAYPDEVVGEGCTRLGLLVGVWRSIGTREMILFDFFGLRDL